MATQNEGFGLHRIRPLLAARGGYLTILAVDDKPGMVSAALVDDFGAALFLESAEVRGVMLPDLPPLNGHPAAGDDQADTAPASGPAGVQPAAADLDAADDAESAPADGPPRVSTSRAAGHSSTVEISALVAENLASNAETISIGLGGLQEMVAANASGLHEWLAVVHLSEQPWTLAYHAIFKKCGHPFPVLAGQAQEISESLGCRAVLLQVDGPDNEIAYRFFSEGKLEEHAHYQPGGKVMEFESQRLPLAAGESLEGRDDPFETLCVELELEIPAAFPSRFPHELMLLSVDPAPVRYGRVDLLVLPLADETSVYLEEDETVVFQNPAFEAPSPAAAAAAAHPETKGFWKNMFERLFGGT